jgi:hypothetical protein
MNEIEIAYSLRYHSAYKRYRDQSKQVKKLLQHVLKNACALLSIPVERVFVNLNPIKGQIIGQFAENRNGDYSITIDPRKCVSKRLLCTTLMHEMVHVQQVHEGRMSYCRINDNFLWNKKVYEVSEVGSRGYQEAPWEIEAYGREKHLGEILLEIIEMTYKF